MHHASSKDSSMAPWRRTEMLDYRAHYTNFRRTTCSRNDTKEAARFVMFLTPRMETAFKVKYNQVGMAARYRLYLRVDNNPISSTLETDIISGHFISTTPVRMTTP